MSTPVHPGIDKQRSTQQLEQKEQTHRRARKWELSTRVHARLVDRVVDQIAPIQRPRLRTGLDQAPRRRWWLRTAGAERTQWRAAGCVLGVVLALLAAGCSPPAAEVGSADAASLVTSPVSPCTARGAACDTSSICCGYPVAGVEGDESFCGRNMEGRSACCASIAVSSDGGLVWYSSCEVDGRP